MIPQYSQLAHPLAQSIPHPTVFSPLFALVYPPVSLPVAVEAT